MPDTKITALTAIGANPIIPSTFPIPMVDLTDTSMAASGTTKKVTVNQILGAGGTATLASATITGDLTVDTNVLKVDTTNNRVGINTASPTAGMALDIVSATSNNFVRFTDGVNATGYLGVRAANGAAYLHANNNIVSLSCSTSNTTPTEQLRITNPGVFEFLDGAGGTRMTLNSTGLGVGLSPSYKLDASATNNLLRLTSANGNDCNIVLTQSGVGNWMLYNAATNGQLRFQFGGNDRMIVDSSGNVGIGVAPSAWGGGIKGLQIGSLGGSSIIGYSNACEIGSNFYFDTGYKYGATAASSQIQFTNGEIRFKNAASGTAGNAITYSQPMTLDGSGNLILQPPSSPPTLGTNGQLTVNATSNTNLRFSYRGSDGVTRVANITLA